MVDVPRAILWDYETAPTDLAWRLQRIAQFFPHFGRDRDTVRVLFENRAALRVPREIVALIELYEDEWRRAESQ
jgi:hypothetical protein